MSSFVKFLGDAHINYANVAVYNDNGRIVICAENVVTGRNIGIMAFADMHELDEWWDAIPGSGAGKLANALDLLSASKSDTA